MDDSRKAAKILLDTKAVTLSPGKPYKYTSGILSPIYCDNRMLISFPKERTIIRNLFLKKLHQHGIEPDALCGIATAGISWAAYLSDVLGKPMAYIRSDKKAHGKENKIEGKLEPGQNVIVVEDLVTTGGSSIAGVQGVRDHGCTVPACLAIFWYQTDVAKKAFSDANCQLITLTSFSDLIEEAKAQHYITPEQEAIVRDWNADPTGWGKRHGFE